MYKAKSRGISHIVSRGSKYRSMAGSPKSVFFGDPVEVSQDVADAISDPGISEQALNAEVVSDAAPQIAAERAQAFERLTPSGKADVVVVPALLISNATIEKNPTTRHIPAVVLNYNLLRCLTDYASTGLVLNTGGSSAGGVYTLTADQTPDTDPDNAGVKSIPIFKFTISASVLNARPGAYYSVWMTGEDVLGQTFTTEGLKYSFTRIDYVQAMMAYMIPFRIISARTVPVLALYGGSTEKKFNLMVEGMASDEQLIMVIPGYSIAETRAISQLYALPAGELVR